MKLNTDIQVLITVLVGFVFFLLLDYTVILGLLVFPFFIYFLLKIKSLSPNRFWIVIVIMAVGVFFVFSIMSFFGLIIAMFIVLLLERTLNGGYSQELTIVYTAFMIGLMILASIISLQSTHLLPSFAEISSQVIDWYAGQLKEVEAIVGPTIDMKVITQSVNQFFTTIPAQILVFGFFLALYTVLIVRVLNPVGKVWHKRPFMYWSVPRFVAHLYFIGLLISLFIGNTEDATFNVISNVMLLVEWALFIHGVAFAFYFMKKKKMHTAVIVLLMILVIIMRPLTIFIGFMELIFRIRLRMELSDGRK